MPTPRNRRWLAALVLGVLSLAALGARLSGIGFFLPHSLEPDAIVFLTQYRAYVGDEREPWRDRYWGFYPHLVPRLASLAPGAPRPAQGAAAAPPATQAEHLRAATAEQLHLRRVVALLSVLAVPATYLLARRFLQRAGALLAAGLMAASLLHLWFAQQARPHGAAVGFALLAVLAQLRLRRRGDPGSYAVAASASALAIAALNSGLAVLPSFLAAHLLREHGGKRRPWLWFGGSIAAIAATIPLAYPYLLAPAGESAIPLFSPEGARVVVAGQPLRLESFGGGFAALASTLRSYEPVLGLLAILAALAAAARIWRARRVGAGHSGSAAWARRHADLAVVLAYALPYALAVGLYAHSYQRFAIPLLPYLAVAGAWGLSTLAELAGRWAWTLRGLGAAALALQILVAGKLAWIRTQPDTHELAGAWVREHAQPESERVLLSPRVDLPLWRTGAALAAVGPFTARVFPWIAHQLEHGPPPAGEPRYDLRTLNVLGEGVQGEIARDPAAFLRAQPFDVLVLDVSHYPPEGREARLREGARAVAAPVARFGASDDPAHDRLWLYYQDDTVTPRPSWWLGVLRARRFGPALEVYVRGP
jgi:hypothetical protein